MTKRIHYRYWNPGLASMDLWLAQPADGPTQRDVAIVSQSHSPVTLVRSGVNLIGKYRLGPWQSLAVVWEFTPREAQPWPRGDTVELAMALRTSPQIGREPEIVARARQLSGGCQTPVAVAQAFFTELVSRYRYTYPVFRRGALAMQRTRRGDCGQFADLFVAWCRAVDIPARTIIGSLVGADGTQPHAWAEFWADGRGWISVDPAMAHAAGNPEAGLGWLPADRFAFSRDVDLPLPEYGPPARPAPLGMLISQIRFGDHRLRWGAEAPNGIIPHFQPAYPRSYRGIGVNFLLTPSQVGAWRVGRQPSRNKLMAPSLGMPLALLAACASTLRSYTGLAALGAISWLLFLGALFAVAVAVLPLLRARVSDAAGTRQLHVLWSKLPHLLHLAWIRESFSRAPRR